jgi:uncharacterized oxidoreductase
MHIAPAPLAEYVAAIFAALGSGPEEAAAIGRRLVDANLAGHDSHGVIRVPYYAQWVREGKVIPNRHVQVVLETPVLAVLEGGYGFGQVLGAEAMELALARAREHGVGVVGLRNSGHLGRIGDWAEMAAAAGMLSLHFVNTTGGGILVAPHGGRERRLSANPVAVGAPRSDGPPIILDMSCCTIAEGKIKVAYNAGKLVPPGCIVDAAGHPTQDPARFYSDPPGSILPIAGHKGYGLGFVTELLAGALSGGACSNPANAHRVANNMLTVVMAPAHFGGEAPFSAETRRFAEWVQSATPTEPGTPILLPGEPEARSREARGTALPLDDTTWGQLVAEGAALGIPAPTPAA